MDREDDGDVEVGQTDSHIPAGEDSAAVLLRALSHSLKNDLHSIAINLEVLRTRLGKSMPAEHAAALLRHLDIATADLKWLQAKIEGAALLFEVEPPQPQQTTAERIVKRAAQEVRPLALQSNVEVGISGESGTPLFLDEAQVAQALAQALRNAVEATSPPAAVTLSLSEGPRAVEIVVANPADPSWLAMEENLAPFRSSKPGHAGVGLVLAQRLLQQNGAMLHIAADGERVAVTITLPKKKS